MSAQPEPLTPEQMRENYPNRFESMCRIALQDAYALWRTHGVTELRHVVVRDQEFRPVAILLPGEVVLATFGPHDNVNKIKRKP